MSPGSSGGSTGSACSGGQTLCSGSCVDTQTDVNNCGLCGNGCSASLGPGADYSLQCNTGACDLLIESLDGFLNLSGATNVAVADGSIFFTMDYCPTTCSVGAVVNVEPTGFLLNPTVDQPSPPWGIAANAEGAYFTVEGTPGNGDGTVMLLLRDGGAVVGVANTPGFTAPTVLASGQDVPWAITSDSANIYWINRSTPGTSFGTVVKMSLAGGEPEALATGQASPWGIAVDSDNVYWVNQGSPDGGNGSVMKVGLDGGTPALIASNQNAPWSIAVDSANVYWTNYGFGADTGSVMAAPIDGGAPFALASGQDSPWGLALDGTSVYWANFGSGTIMKANLDGTNPTLVATGIVGPQAIVVDSTSLYYTSYGTGVGILTRK
jgi:hypothetical protein